MSVIRTVALCNCNARFLTKSFATADFKRPLRRVTSRVCCRSYFAFIALDRRLIRKAKQHRPWTGKYLAILIVTAFTLESSLQYYLQAEH